MKAKLGGGGKEEFEICTDGVSAAASVSLRNWGLRQSRPQEGDASEPRTISTAEGDSSKVPEFRFVLIKHLFCREEGGSRAGIQRASVCRKGFLTAILETLPSVPHAKGLLEAVASGRAVMTDGMLAGGRDVNQQMSSKGALYGVWGNICTKRKKGKKTHLKDPP